jgi:hypothetical protein
LHGQNRLSYVMLRDTALRYLVSMIFVLQSDRTGHFLVPFIFFVGIGYHTRRKGSFVNVVLSVRVLVGLRVNVILFIGR